MANLKTCAKHGYYAAGWVTCPECQDNPTVLDLPLKPRFDFQHEQRQASKQETPVNAVTTQAVPFKIVKPKRVTGIKPILAKLGAEGMTTNNQIFDGVRTGKVVQTISWQVSYDKVLDYLETQGFNVTLYRSRIVCGSQAA